MPKDFAKVVELYQPQEKDLRAKQDCQEQPSDNPYVDQSQLPLAIRCPQLGRLITSKDKDPGGGPQECC
ncbi:hypothetical protein Dthio_PD1432 [Desulfonatronospira thiodismutans ASO3-1]|uniref:Uncharacterized protein n=1 Tax=Desulfonatronospira thiodismutans ASO3-1 TaxID=555779 RepID=D6STS6_9BACT|nr:hypothetical protein [Desulfonatronospira thiodismutans]EFI34092.1 hypothetical protein Dthio_PD1432 [Desulfonatronospira thiodismutans ASO3-1]